MLVAEVTSEQIAEMVMHLGLFALALGFVGGLTWWFLETVFEELARWLERRRDPRKEIEQLERIRAAMERRIRTLKGLT